MVLQWQISIYYSFNYKGPERTTRIHWHDPEYDTSNLYIIWQAKDVNCLCFFLLLIKIAWRSLAGLCTFLMLYMICLCRVGGSFTHLLSSRFLGVETCLQTYPQRITGRYSVVVVFNSTNQKNFKKKITSITPQKALEYFQICTIEYIHMRVPYCWIICPFHFSSKQLFRLGYWWPTRKVFFPMYVRITSKKITQNSIKKINFVRVSCNEFWFSNGNDTEYTG